MAVGSRAATRGPPWIPHSAFRIPHRFIHSALRICLFPERQKVAKSRYAPGPRRHCRKKLSPVYTYLPLPTAARAVHPGAAARRDRASRRARVGGIPIMREIQSPLLHQPRHRPVRFRWGRGTRAARVQDRHRRGLIVTRFVRARDREGDTARKPRSQTGTAGTGRSRDRRRGRSPAAVRCSRRARARSRTPGCRPRSRRPERSPRASVSGPSSSIGTPTACKRLGTRSDAPRT